MLSLEIQGQKETIQSKNSSPTTAVKQQFNLGSSAFPFLIFILFIEDLIHINHPTFYQNRYIYKILYKKVRSVILYHNIDPFFCKMYLK